MSNFLSSDVYEITQLIEDIKTRNMGGVSSLTLAMSIFGYFSEISSAMMQSAVVMASEYSNEAIPVKAKFENVDGKLVADTVKEYVNYSHLK